MRQLVMFSEVFLAIYCGSLFFISFVVAPVLLRVRESKNVAGRFYGRILWRFYSIAFFLLLLYLILEDERIYAVFLMLGLGLNVGISFWLKNYKRAIGNIDLITYEDPRRVLFRRVSLMSTLMLFINFLLSLFILVKQLKGGGLAGL
ncbi:MAG: hypothetical protein N3D14_05170 [Aquificaceae bacterium]|nr:hypothetical protein [Aquificaceae bacterium]